MNRFSVNRFSVNRLPASISDRLKSGEKMIQRFDVSVPLAERRKDQAMMAFSVTVIYGVMLLGLLLICRVPLQALSLAMLLVFCAVSWKIFGSFLKFILPNYSELVVTNQRLILRAGPAYIEWVSDYGNEIEVFVLAELSSFAVRPSGPSCSPREVYVKSVSPFQNGRQLADLFRSFRETRMLESGSPLDSNSITGSAGAPAHVPPGIAVTHAFLSHQLRTLIWSISGISGIPGISVLPPTKSLSACADASQCAESSPTTQTPPELGDTSYQFGVDK